MDTFKKYDGWSKKYLDSGCGVISRRSEKHLVIDGYMEDFLKRNIKDHIIVFRYQSLYYQL